MKVTHQLGTAGWIETVRGKGGGIRLAQPASEVRLGLVMRGVERDFNLVECFSTEHSCTLTGQCRLAHIIEEALADFLKRMDQYTLEDILTPPQPNQHRSPHPND